MLGAIKITRLGDQKIFISKGKKLEIVKLRKCNILLKLFGLFGTHIGHLIIFTPLIDSEEYLLFFSFHSGKYLLAVITLTSKPFFLSQKLISEVYFPIPTFSGKKFIPYTNIFFFQFFKNVINLILQ